MGELLNSKKPKARLPIEEADGMGYQMNRINNMEVLLKSMSKYFQIKSIKFKYMQIKDTKLRIHLLSTLNPFLLYIK